MSRTRTFCWGLALLITGIIAGWAIADARATQRWLRLQAKWEAQYRLASDILDADAEGWK